MMKQTVLYKRSNFFIDVFNVMLCIDLFFYHEIKTRINTDDCIKYYFEENLPDVEDTPSNDTYLTILFASKTHQNILYDWIDEEKFLESNSKDAMDQYLGFLYRDILENPTCDQFIQSTGFANTIKILSNDRNVLSITLWLPFQTDFIMKSLNESFRGYGLNKINIYIGEKKADAKEFRADAYTFENISDVDKYLRNPHQSLIEVIVPAYEFNMMVDRTKLEKFYEQVTYRRLRLEEPNSNYREKYNLSINSLSVPV